MQSEGAAGRGGWGLVVALLLVLSVLWVVAVRRQPPPPRPASAPATKFSGERALAVLRDLVGDGRPHPIGSPANAAVRDRVMAHLRAAGYAPEVQRTAACVSRFSGCGRAENVVARLEGTAQGGAILLMAHYDSVPAGPGVSDDLSGTAAVLEVARALKAGPPPRNPVIILLNDGEEAGLLGAQGFADSPLAREVKVILNLEARGTRGPSLMFESIGNDGWMIPLFAAGASRPVTSSVFVTIYQMLPNNTDLTVFKPRPDVDGLNFAFVENPTHYHTAVDDLASLDPASLQHHGDNALGAVRHLAEADLAHRPRGDAVFFDVLGWTVVRWPAGWSLPIALAVLALALLAVWRGRSGRGLTPWGMLLGLLAFLLLVAVTGLLAFGLTLALRDFLPVPWIARWQPLVAAFWALPVLVAGLLLPGLGRRAGGLGLYTGVWLGWALCGVALAVAAPGVSYLFLVPGLIAGLAGLALVRGASPRTGALAVLPVLAGGVLWFPVLLPLYDGLGTGALVPVAVLLAILVAGLAPLFLAARPAARWLVAGASLLVVVAGAGLGAGSPAYSESSPQWAVVQYLQDTDAGTSSWVVVSTRPFPAAFRQAAQFGPQPEAVFPWFPRQRFFRAPAPSAGLPAPELTVLQESAAPGGRRRLQLRLVSPRGAGRATVYLPATARLASLSYEGHPVELLSLGEFSVFQLAAIPPEGATFEAELGERTPQEWWVADQTAGLPAGGEALLAARPAEAVSFQDGDVTLVSRKLKI